MSRVFILVAAVLVFFWLLRRALGSRKQDDRPSAPKPRVETSDLVSCAHCGVHLPKNEAVATAEGGAAGQFFCSEDHRRRGKR